MRVIKAALLAPLWAFGLLAGYVVRPIFEGAVYGFYAREFAEQKRKQKIVEEYSDATIAKEKEILNELYTGETGELYKYMCDVVDEFDRQKKQSESENEKAEQNTKEED